MSRLKRSREALIFVAVLLCSVATIVWALPEMWDFIEDDTLISLRYSQRLVQGQGLTWTDGERVEGYSNLSWVLAVAALGAMGIDWIVSVRVVSIACVLITFWALLSFVRRTRGSPAAMATAGLALGATATVPVWLVGGLEQPMVTACLCVSLWGLAAWRADRHRVRSREWIIGVSLGVLVLTRPDSPLFVALLLAAGPLLMGFARWKAEWRRWIVVGAVPLAAAAGQLVFRLAYYGEWVPNTALIKAATSPARIAEGLKYVSTGLHLSWLLVGVAGLGLLLSFTQPRARRWAPLLLAWGLCWLGYVILIGGDHFPGWRHLLPFDVVAAAFVGIGVGALDRNVAVKNGGALVLLLVSAHVPQYMSTQWAIRDVNIVRVARWQWEGASIGRTLGEAFHAQQPLYAVTAAGCLPFFSGLPSLDLMGLNDKHIARTPPDPGLPLAHDHGDGKYVLARAPDLITFGMPRGGGPTFKSGAEMSREPAFQRDYLRVRFQSLEPLSLYSETFVRIGGKVGLQRPSQDVLVVPGYLLAGTTAIPMPELGMGAIVPAGELTRFTLPPLPPGEWQARVRPANPRVVVRLTTGIQRAAGASSRVVLEVAQPVGLQVESLGLTSVIGELIVERVSTPAVIADAPAPEESTATPLLFGARFEPWTVTGDWNEPDTGAQVRPGQQAIRAGTPSFANSFHERTGDHATGVLASPPRVVTPGSWLEFRVGGGHAIGAETQVGVRVIERTKEGKRVVRFVASGRDDEELREERLDLGWLAGREVSIEIFDAATGAWGHVLAGGFVWHEGP